MGRGSGGWSRSTRIKIRQIRSIRQIRVLFFNLHPDPSHDKRAALCYNGPMNRRQLAFVIVLNALISLAIALSVAWVIEARRPDPEELAALAQPAVPSSGAAPAQGSGAPQAAPPASPTSEVAPDQPAAVATEAPATPPPAAVETPAEEEIYIVQAGDSLGAIAARFGVSLADIMAANELDNPDYVFSGQRLVIPAAGAAATAAQNATPTTAVTPAPTGQGIRIGALESPGNLLSEAVSIVNDSDLAVNLQGWRLERAGGPAYTFASVSLFPGGNLWVHTRAGENTSIALYWGQPEPVWRSGDTVQLVNPEGTVIASYPVP
jgi:LysM repeat protein